MCIFAVPLSESTNIDLLEQIVSDQRTILTDVFNGTDVTTIPQMWTLCTSPSYLTDGQLIVILGTDQEVLGYYEDGMRVPDDVTLVWTDDKCVSCVPKKCYLTLMLHNAAGETSNGTLLQMR